MYSRNRRCQLTKQIKKRKNAENGLSKQFASSAIRFFSNSLLQQFASSAIRFFSNSLLQQFASSAIRLTLNPDVELIVACW
jgi:hypothetical protein